MKQRKFFALLVFAVILSFAGTAFAGIGITFSKTTPTEDGGEMTIAVGVDDTMFGSKIIGPEYYRRVPPPHHRPVGPAVPPHYRHHRDVPLPPPPPPHHRRVGPAVPPPLHHHHVPSPYRGPRPGDIGRGPVHHGHVPPPHRPPHHR